MNKLLRSLPFVTAGALLTISAVAYAEGTTDYLLVKDLPFIGNTTSLGGYLSNLFKLGLGVAVTLAVVMIVMNGIQYMFSDIPGVKISAKSNLGDIIWGLVLAFGSWLILATINPNILNFDFITSLNKAADMAGEDVAKNQPELSSCSTNCVKIPDNITKRTSCGGQECKLDQGLVARIVDLNTKLLAEHIPWAITEAWPTTGTHRSLCHGRGTCFDGNITGAPTADSLIKFINAALSVGLRATYEVRTQKELDDWVNLGVPKGSIQVNTADGFSAPHFHII